MARENTNWAVDCEKRVYQKEIDLAESYGFFGVANDLRELRDAETNHIIQGKP